MTENYQKLKRYGFVTGTSAGKITFTQILPFNDDINDDDIKYSKSFNKISLKRVLIIVNPSAGFGKSIKITSSVLIPCLHKNGISTVIFKSDKGGSILNYLVNDKSKILNYNIDGFIVVGGDGTMQEFINGYINGGYIECNIGIIFVNGGTGNSICMTMNGFNDFENSSMKLYNYIQNIIDTNNDKNVSNKIIMMDSIELYDHNNKFIYNVCSQSYFGVPSATVHTAAYTKYVFGTSPLRYNILY